MHTKSNVTYMLTLSVHRMHYMLAYRNIIKRITCHLNHPYKSFLSKCRPKKFIKRYHKIHCSNDLPIRRMSPTSCTVKRRSSHVALIYWLFISIYSRLLHWITNLTIPTACTWYNLCRTHYCVVLFFHI